MHVLPFSIWLLLAPAAYAFTPSEFHKVDYDRMYARDSDDLQTFNGSLGSPAPPITNSGDNKRPFTVNGNTFTDFMSAAQRTCDVQFDSCQKMANAQGNKGSLTVNDCDDQKSQCNQAQSSAKVQSFDGNNNNNNGNNNGGNNNGNNNGGSGQQINLGQDPNDPNFDLICDAN